VLKELERLNNGMESMNKELTNIRVEIAMLKVKSGMWGAVGACIPIAIMLAIYFFTRGTMPLPGTP
jgi:hypothetical protein